MNISWIPKLVSVFLYFKCALSQKEDSIGTKMNNTLFIGNKGYRICQLKEVLKLSEYQK
jgi:hypothetical protein